MQAVSRAIEEFGHVDILVNNAAVTSSVSSADMSDREWSRVIDINLKGAMMMSRECIRLLEQRGGGSIVNIASVAALRGFSAPAYAAAKGGLLALTVDMAGAYGSKGVRVNAIIPGHVYTNMVTSQDDSDLGREMRRKASPLGTEGSGWHVAWATLFLAGPNPAGPQARFCRSKVVF